MSDFASKAPIGGFFAPLHRALTEPILLASAPRSIAILNGTLAAALGLGLRLRLVDLALWAIGHFAAVWAANTIRSSSMWCAGIGVFKPKSAS